MLYFQMIYACMISGLLTYVYPMSVCIVCQDEEMKHKRKTICCYEICILLHNLLYSSINA
jgi:hypothetical protein